MSKLNKLEQLRETVFQVEDRLDRAVSVYREDAVTGCALVRLLKGEFDETGITTASFAEYADKDRLRQLTRRFESQDREMSQGLSPEQRAKVEKILRFIDERPDLERLIRLMKRKEELDALRAEEAATTKSIDQLRMGTGPRVAIVMSVLLALATVLVGFQAVDRDLDWLWACAAFGLIAALACGAYARTADADRRDERRKAETRLDDLNHAIADGEDDLKDSVSESSEVEQLHVRFGLRATAADYERLLSSRDAATKHIRQVTGAISLCDDVHGSVAAARDDADDERQDDHPGQVSEDDHQIAPTVQFKPWRTFVVASALVALLAFGGAYSLGFLPKWGSQTAAETVSAFLNAAVAGDDVNRFLAPGADASKITKHVVLRYEVKNVGENIVTVVVFFSGNRLRDLVPVERIEMPETLRFRVDGGRITGVF